MDVIVRLWADPTGEHMTRSTAVLEHASNASTGLMALAWKSRSV